MPVAADPFGLTAILRLARFVYDEVDEVTGREMIADVMATRSDSTLEECREEIVELLTGEGYTEAEMDSIEQTGRRS